MADHHAELASALNRDRPQDAVPALLRVFAGQPSAVVIEDLHWADDAALDAIRYLARRFASTPSALVLTFRETGVDAGHPLRQLLGSLVGPAVHRVNLPPLSVHGVRRLGAASEEEAAEIHRVTEGNPFFVTEVLAAGGHDVPGTVRDVLLARLGGLSPPARRLVERLSVIPTRAERWLAEILTDGDPTALVEGERSGMLVGDSAWVAFRHELARRTIESSLTPSERLAADRTVMSALLHHPGVEPSRLVHHAQRSGRTDVILEHGPAAAHEAIRLGAHRQAAEVLRFVLDRRDLLEPHDAIELTVQRAYSLYLVNQFDAALGAQSAVAAAGASDDAVLLADALLVLARVVFFARGPMRAREAAARAVEILEPVHDDARLAAGLTELARAHSNLVTVSIVADPCERAETAARRAVAMAQRIGRPGIEAQALCYLGDARLARGDTRGYADQVRAIAIAGSDVRRETKVRSYVNAAHGAFRSARLDDAERMVGEGLRAAADFEFFAGQYRLRLTGAAVHAARGEWEHAIAELRELIATPGEPGVMAPVARSMLARLLARCGQTEASDVIAAALADRAVGDDPFIAGTLAVARVELGWLDGSLGDLTEEVQHALDGAAALGQLSVHAELCAYLRRAGIDVPAPADPPGPWAPTLTGRWQEAAAAWTSLGDRYEAAVVLATAPDPHARARGEDTLRRLGAVGTLAAV